MSKSDEMMKSFMASMASQSMGIFLQGKEEQLRMNQRFQETLRNRKVASPIHCISNLFDELISNMSEKENTGSEESVSAPDYKAWYEKAVEEIKSLKAVIELYEEIVTPEQLTAKQKEKELNAGTFNSKGVN